MELAGAKVVKRTKVTRALVERGEAGRGHHRHRRQAAHGRDRRRRRRGHVVNAWQVLRERGQCRRFRRRSPIGAADWIGLGLAEMLARQGCRVRLCVDGCMAGQRLPSMCAIAGSASAQARRRDRALCAALRRRWQVRSIFSMLPAGNRSCSRVLIPSSPPMGSIASPNWKRNLRLVLKSTVHLIGDCATPRTAEEAVLEGLKVATAL